MYHGFAIRVPQKNALELGQLLENSRDKMIKDYNEGLELGQIIVRARSVVIECGSETRLNVLADIVENIIPSKYQAKVPYWS
jgi:hypothetical protein